jgi:hypothetical protein
MLIVRCTARLFGRLKVKPQQEPRPSTTKLGDWYATILSMRPAHLVLLVNDSTRLAAVLPARELSSLAKRIPEAIAEVLRELGAPADVIAEERRAMAEIAFAKTASRSVLGTMNDFVFHMELRAAAHEDIDLLELAMFLNRTPVSPLSYKRPDDVVKEALGVAIIPGRSKEQSRQEGRQSLERTATIYQLKVTLRDVTPPIWRRVRVRSNTTLPRLHSILQTVMGWTNSHLHEFVAKGGSYGKADPESPQMYDEKRVALSDLLRLPDDHLVYVYDFGDGWKHDVLLEQVLDADPDAEYPYVVDGERACPPEDCGGAPGYVHLLQVLAKRSHPEHRELAEWVGGSFDPEAYDAREINRAFHGGWSPRKATSARRSETALPAQKVLKLVAKRGRP